MSTNGSTPPGWYLDAEGRPRWWNGTEWTRDQPAGSESGAVPTTDAPAPADASDASDGPSSSAASAEPAGALAIIALILALLSAPLGLVLGILSIVSARRRGRRAPVPGIVATVVGALGTLAVIAVVVALTVLAQTSDVNSRKAAYCQAVAADPALLADIDAARDRMYAASSGSRADALVLSDYFLTLASRVETIRDAAASFDDEAYSSADWLARDLRADAGYVADYPLDAPLVPGGNDDRGFGLRTIDECAE